MSDFLSTSVQLCTSLTSREQACSDGGEDLTLLLFNAREGEGMSKRRRRTFEKKDRVRVMRPPNYSRRGSSAWEPG